MSRHRQRLLLPALGVVAAALLIVSGCTNDDGGTVRAGDTRARVGVPATTDQTETTPPASTSAPTTAPPATTAPAPAGEATPRAAAERLYETWKADDRSGAMAVATPEAVDSMWATAPGDYSLYSDCDSAEFDTSGCLYRGDPGTIQFTMERQGQAWVVIEALYSAP